MVVTLHRRAEAGQGFPHFDDSIATRGIRFNDDLRPFGLEGFKRGVEVDKIGADKQVLREMPSVADFVGWCGLTSFCQGSKARLRSRWTRRPDRQAK